MNRELTKKQEKVLKLYLAGYKPKEIGKLLGLHINTVCSYKSIVMEKWEVENNVELIIEAVRRGYIEIEEPEEVSPTYTRIKKQDLQIIYTYIPGKK